MSDNVLGTRIKYLREKQDLSQTRLASSLDITNTQLSRYESGDRKPDPETITRIANYFEVSTDYLLGRTNDPSPHGTSIEGLAFFGGPDEELTEDEREHLKESLEQFRKLKAKFLANKKSD
jgi:transcriptional regulator with XRE-family HTH domain